MDVVQHYLHLWIQRRVWCIFVWCVFVCWFTRVHACLWQHKYTLRTVSDCPINGPTRKHACTDSMLGKERYQLTLNSFIYSTPRLCVRGTNMDQSSTSVVCVHVHSFVFAFAFIMCGRMLHRWWQWERRRRKISMRVWMSECDIWRSYAAVKWWKSLMYTWSCFTAKLKWKITVPVAFVRVRWKEIHVWVEVWRH